MQPVNLGAQPPALRAGEREPSVGLLQYAWNVVMSRLGTFVGLSFLALVATFATLTASMGVAVLLGVRTVHTNFHSGPISVNTGTGGSHGSEPIAVQIISVLIQAFVIGPIIAGVYGVVFQLLRWDPEYIKGFSAFSKRYLPVAGSQLIVGVFTIGGNVALYKLLTEQWASLFNGLWAVVLAFLAVLVIPAIVGLEMNAVDAIAYSLKRVLSKPLAYFGYFVGASILSFIGVVACGIGLVLTMAISNVAFALLITGILPVPGASEQQGPYPRGPEQAY